MCQWAVFLLIEGRKLLMILSVLLLTDGGGGVHVISNRSSIQKDCFSYVTRISQIERIVFADGESLSHYLIP